MPETPEVSVVVPVKDEAGNVAPLAREVAAALRGERYEMKIGRASCRERV